MLDPLRPSSTRSTNHAGMLSKAFNANIKTMSMLKHTSRKLRMPIARTHRGASSGPTRTPRNAAPALRPFSVTLVPRASSNNGSSGAAWPMLRPNTVTDAIAAARLQRRVLALVGGNPDSVICMAPHCRYRGLNATTRQCAATLDHR